MTLDEFKRYVDFMRTDLVEISTEKSIMLVGEGASDEARAEARQHNATPGAREMMPEWLRMLKDGESEH